MQNELSAEEIREIRKSYGLSQQAFARVLGIGEASIARYENGQTPTRAIANLIRAARIPEFMLDCLERDGSRISPEQKEETERIVYSIIQLDQDGEIVNMNQVYEITLQQEILNEQAAEMLADLHRMQWLAEDIGDEARADIYRDAAMRIALAKHKITSEDYGTEKGLAELRGGMTALMDFAKSLQSKAA